MGNNNSGQSNKPDVSRTENNTSLLKTLYAKDSENNTKKIKQDIFDTADEIYDRVWDGNKNIYIERRVEIFADPLRGISLPYISDKDAFSSENNYNQILSSENPRYIEFIVCNGNMEEFIQKFPVGKSTLDHECDGNCRCIEGVIEVLGDKNKIYTKNHNNNFSQTSAEQLTLSPTSSEPYNSIRAGNKNNNHSGMKSKVVQDKSNDQICKPIMAGGLACRQPMLGGANNKNNNQNETSPEDITESEEETDNIFSTTSEISDTTTSPIFNNKSKNNQTNRKKNSKQEIREETTIDEFDDDDEDIDIDDEVLEGLDDEDITEDGYILEQSDITSSDLYRMQSRIFGSETDTSEYNVTNNNARKNGRYNRNNTNNMAENNTRKNTRNNQNNIDNDDNTTERVRRAINKMNSRNTIFDTEDRDILDMNSSTDKYMKRPTNRNTKYI